MNKTTTPFLQRSLAATALAFLLSTFNSSLSTSFAQGSLTPPGAPAPMMKTLAQIEPRIPIGTNTTPGDAGTLFNITQPGSYYLTTNLAGVTNKHGISINSPGVTLDLMGFELAGVPNSLTGVNLTPGSSNVVVRNGTLRNWGYIGINGASSEHCAYENLRLNANGFRGVSCGAMSVVTRCSARFNTLYQLNGGSGIFAEYGATISGCTASDNATRGIEAGFTAVTVSDCTAFNNTTDGIYIGTGCVVRGCAASNNKGRGIFAGGSDTVVDCAAYQNTLDGIYGGDAVTISRCTVFGNHLFGITAYDGSTVDRCTAYNNLAGGIYAGDGSTVGGCVAYVNPANGIVTANGSTISGCVAYLNTSNGITTGNGCTVTGCTARTNKLDGIVGTFACAIRDCTLSDNKQDGIQVISGSTLAGNNCYNNGAGTNNGAGIHVTGNNNRIDGNHVSFASRGIDVSGIDNLIVRNSVSFTSTNFVIGVNNKVGFIVAPPNSGAISGSTGGAGVGTTDPWANLSY